jgi:2-polyprenyl-3-methyl-5-hydroxy-6-metoxy-1,4-benzoquinol methylase
MTRGGAPSTPLATIGGRGLARAVPPACWLATFRHTRLPSEPRVAGEAPFTRRSIPTTIRTGKLSGASKQRDDPPAHTSRSAARGVTMSSGPIVPMPTFQLLDETQNKSFDKELHSPGELATKFTHLDDLMDRENFNVLDLGGGNGHFADELLVRFPESTVTILDISSLLLSKNKSNPRKELIFGSIENMSHLLGERKFDCITINWVLHHLVGNNYVASRENCIATLEHCKVHLNPNGMLIIADYLFDGYLKTNIPSHIIFSITKIKWRWFVRIAKRFFNTAGVGVCFRSRQAWEHIFAEAGFGVVTFEQGLEFPSWSDHLLAIKLRSNGHFFLKASD